MKLELELKTGKPEEIEADVLAVPVFEDEDVASQEFAVLRSGTDGLIAEVLQSREFRGRPGDFYLVPRPPKLHAKRLLLCGAGRRAQYDADRIRQLMSNGFARWRQVIFKRVALWKRQGVEVDRTACAAVEGLILASYDPEEFKTSDRAFGSSEVTFILGGLGPLRRGRVQHNIERARILAECVNFARHLTNQPGNIVTPAVLAEKAEEVARQGNLKIEVLDEKQMQRIGMHALLGVARGSVAPPRLIVLSYMPASGRAGRKQRKGPLALVGKGVTFDTGGINIKPSQSMEEMKADKAGACAVLGAMRAVAQLKPQREVLAVIPSVENMPSGAAQRPGDVVKSLSGKTIEITNTDAEGRLILADALTYARQLGARELVDIATLTGACVVALGHVCAGLFASDDTLRDRLMQASRRAGEKLWQFPLYDDYKKEIQSDIADMKNSGSRWGGAIYAAKFLQEFVEDTPWAHLDIAGVDLFKDDTSPLKGATGFGVRTLAELCFL
ncbi:MAG: leucyl aminopeptidase [Acidobacteria bacterium]|nr:leucyl aminopeptidase [Acidobacteriota bacterium]